MADPKLTSWFTDNSGQYARIYPTVAAESAGTKSSTWSRGAGNQANPVYADIHEIRYSANWVYIRTSGLASHVMGPWYLNAAKTNLFPNYPSNTSSVYRIPRNSTIPTTKTLTGNGAIGRMVNGVSMFDSRDALSYRNSAGVDATVGGVAGDGIWNRDGYHNEGVTFDPALAHQAGNNYHYHAQPIGLRHQLGDHVDYNATTNRYTESATPVTNHSPILAWAADGLPVYGPYGYSSPMNPASGVRRMVSGFALRDGTNGTTAITVRQILPLWAQRVQNRTTLAANQYGPAVNATYLLGHYLEDFDYRGDLGQTVGVDFDLNEQNVRFCVTPEFPAGTWAYFTTIYADGTPAFPYTTGRQYFGSPTGGNSNLATMNADTPQTTHFLGGANTPLTVESAEVDDGTVTITWNAVEGGTYSVDSSPDASSWTNQAAGLTSTGVSRAASYPASSSSGTEYGRVNRTALATYDTAGQTAATVAQSVTTSYQTGSPVPPVVGNPSSSNVTGNSASLGGDVTNAGSEPVTARGVVFSLSSINPSPQLDGSGVTSASAVGTTGVFVVQVTGLSAGSEYAYAAYATSSAGTSYSPVGTFVTMSNDSGLSSLVFHPATLLPVFGAGTFSYSTTVSNTVSSVTVTPAASHAAATIQVNSVPVVSGQTSGSIPVAVGANTITMTVTAQDGVTASTYTVLVYRESAIESWRQNWYGTSANSGDAADDADPFHTGVPNLAVYALLGPAINPAQASADDLPKPQLDGGNFLYDFSEPANVSGVTYGAESSSGMENDWQAVIDSGTGPRHVFSVSTNGLPRQFLRLKVTRP